MDDDKSFALELLEMQGVHTRNLITAIVAVAVAAIVGLATVVGIFVWYLDQYDFTSTNITQSAETTAEDGGSAAAIINDEGEVTINGTSEGIQD